MITREMKEGILGALRMDLSKDVELMLVMELMYGEILSVDDLRKLLGYDVRRRCVRLLGRKYLRQHGKGCYSLGWEGRRYLRDRVYESVFEKVMDIRSLINGIKNDV